MRKLKPRKFNSNVQARMVPLIDVVFLLLIFFIMTVNFRQHEGFMPAELPGQVTTDDVSEVDPMVFYINTTEQGGCQVSFAGNTVSIAPGSSDFGYFRSEVDSVMNLLKRRVTDPVMLIDSNTTSWQHMMNVYNALGDMGYSNIVLSGN